MFNLYELSIYFSLGQEKKQIYSIGKFIRLFLQGIISIYIHWVTADGTVNDHLFVEVNDHLFVEGFRHKIAVHTQQINAPNQNSN